MITIDELIAYSEDSKLLCYSYKNNTLNIRLNFNGINKIIVIDIPTEKLSINRPKNQDEVFLTWIMH